MCASGCVQVKSIPVNICKPRHGPADQQGSQQRKMRQYHPYGNSKNGLFLFVARYQAQQETRQRNKDEKWK